MIDFRRNEITYPIGVSENSNGTMATDALQDVAVMCPPTETLKYSGNTTVISNSGVLTWSISGASVLPLSPKMVTVAAGTLPQESALAGQTVSSFEIGKYEVTWGEWKEVSDWALSNKKGYDLGDVGDTYPSGSGNNFPVINVSWYDVVKWCNAKSEKEGKTPVYTVNGFTYKTGKAAPAIKTAANGYRLPSEKEWEWAARGGVSGQGSMYSGSNECQAVAWTQENPPSGSKEVGTKQANELGIYDMSGNVWEWCEDSVDTSRRRTRGGSWFDIAELAAVANRGLVNYPGDRSCDLGFRLVLISGN
jgi:formylglycine-generating enzyme required for sulfatase activity